LLAVDTVASCQFSVVSVIANVVKQSSYKQNGLPRRLRLLAMTALIVALDSRLRGNDRKRRE
jgi:hypothetical protein